jgi:hypothetical protein
MIWAWFSKRDFARVGSYTSQVWGMRLWLEAEKDLFNTTLNLYCKRLFRPDKNPDRG